MPERLQCSSSSSSEGDEHRNEDAAQLCINGASSAADEGEHTAFMPLAPVVGTDGATYESFGAYIASMPSKNCHVVPDERFQRFVRILNGESTPDDSLAQLKRDREKLFNTKELDAKARMAHASRLVLGSCTSVLTCALAEASNAQSVKTHTKAGSKRWCRLQSVKQ